MRKVGSGEYLTLPLSLSGEGLTHHLVGSKKAARRTFLRRWNSLPRVCRTTVIPGLAVLFCVGTTLLLWSSQLEVPDVQNSLPNSGGIGKSRDDEEVIKSEKLEDDRTADYQAEHGQILPPRPQDPNVHVDEAQHAADEAMLLENFEGQDYDREAYRKKHFPLGVSFSGPRNPRQKAVVNSFLHAWKGYKTFAWGQDHLKPISKSYSDWFGLGLTIVDALDTMYMMNLLKGKRAEFREARDWISEKMVIGVKKDVNLFETTIRVLGGLLAAFHLSRDSAFLTKAEDLGDRLLVAFNTPSGIPFSDVNLYTRTAKSPGWSPDSSTSEVTTIQLEFRDLSRIVGDPKYEVAAAKVNEIIHNIPKPDGLVPIYISPRTGRFRARSTKTLGARGDSYYEYLIKQWIQTGKTKDYLLKDFEEAMDGVLEHLVRRTKSKNILFIGELTEDRRFYAKMDHLTCFLPGTIIYGIHHGLPDKYLKFAEELMHTCYLTYSMNPTFLAAELTHFNSEDDGPRADMYVNPNDAHNLLRPETVESLFYMYYFTGNRTYQDWGWEIFQAFEKYAKVTHGYSSIGNVRNADTPRHRDMMESFFLGETLKYFYLLFGEDAINGSPDLSLDDWVINTEAHPLPIYTS